jgi:hypothetical protein
MSRKRKFEEDLLEEFNNLNITKIIDVNITELYKKQKQQQQRIIFKNKINNILKSNYKIYMPKKLVYVNNVNKETYSFTEETINKLLDNYSFYFNDMKLLV